MKSRLLGLLFGLACVVVLPAWAQLSDLQPLSVQLDGTATAGAYLNFSYTATNRGDADSPAGFMDYLFVSSNAVLDEADLGIGNAMAQNPVQAGSSYYGSGSATALPLWPAGVYYLILKLDHDAQNAAGGVEESVETNNVLVAPFTMAAPDLLAVSVRPLGSMQSGGMVDLESVVSNAGNADVTAYWSAELYLSTDSVVDATDRSLTSFTYYPNLAVGERLTVTNLSVSVPQVPGGQYYLILAVDTNYAGSAIAESDELNNRVATQVTISQPDLVPASVRVLGQMTSGGMVSLECVVSNAGNATANGGWYDGVYLSTDTVLSTNDTFWLQPYQDQSLAGQEARALTNQSVMVPSLPGGTYYLIYVVDTNWAGGTVAESDEANNQLAVSVSIGQPDLVPVRLTVLGQMNSGESVSLECVVSNAGNATANGGWYDAVYVSTDAVLSTNDTFWIQPYHEQSLAGQEARALTNQSVMVPSLPGGTYYLIYVVDTNGTSGTIAESDETNNHLAVPVTIGQPDLVPVRLAVLGQMNSGESVSLECVVSNAGNATANAGWYDAVYLSTDAVLSTNDTFWIQPYQDQSLAGDEVRALTNQSVMVPSLPGGMYYLIYVVDTNGTSGTIAESDETNNHLAVPVTIAQPDLVPVSVSALGPLAAGEMVELECVVSNAGNATANAGWYDAIYLSTDTVLSTNDHFWVQPYHDQAIGAHDVAVLTNFSMTIPSLMGGAYYLIYVVDTNWAGGSVAESVETNNQILTQVTIAQSDLVPFGLTPLGTVAPGEAVSLEYGVSNIGNATARAGWYDSLYVSVDDQLDTNDYYWGMTYHDQEIAGGAQRVVTNWPGMVPPLTAGTYRLILVVDTNWWGGSVSESREDNNLLMTTFELRLPDLTITNIELAARVSPGQMAQVVLHVQNRGNATAHPYWYDYLYLSLDDNEDTNDVYLGAFYEWEPIPAGATAVVTNWIWIPQGTTDGVYRVLVAADHDGYMNESDESNNRRVQVIQVAVPSYDLGFVTVALEQGTTEGYQLRLVRSARNQGADAIQLEPYAYWWDSYYISTNPVWTANEGGGGTMGGGVDYQMVAQFPAPKTTLASGETYAETNDVYLPPWNPGRYYLHLRVNECCGSLVETSQANNGTVLAVNLAAPDLEITSFVVGGQAVPGGQAQAIYTVHNAGDGTAQAGLYNGIYFSLDAVQDASDTMIFSDWQQQALAPGQSYTVTNTFALPQEAVGIFHLIVAADAMGWAVEGNEANNTRAAQVSVEEPDLVPVSIPVAGALQAGSVAYVSYTITNVGVGAAVYVAGANGTAGTAGGWFDELYLSTDAVWDADDRFLSSLQRILDVPAGAAYTATNAVAIPELVSGSYYLLCRADAWCNLTESTETNNIVAVAVTVTNAPEDRFETGMGETEQNDVREHAANIVGFGMSIPIDDLIQNDEDWYRIYLSMGQERIAATCDFAHVEGDLGLALFDGAGQMLANANGSGNTEGLEYTTPIDGFYYLLVYGENKGTPYTLRWTSASAGGKGILKCSISPAEAEEAGALWQPHGFGTTWFGGTNEVRVVVGESRVDFKAIPGWIAPPATSVTVTAFGTTVVAAVYEKQVPLPAFSGSPLSGTVPLDVVFADQSRGVITNEVWTLGDGAVVRVAGTTNEIRHTYTNAGTFTVRLDVAGPGGRTNVVETNYVTVVIPAPDAQFIASTNRGVAPLQVVFTDASTGDITNRYWDFDNDGAWEAAGTNATVVTGRYALAGVYSVKLRVAGRGGVDTEMKSSYVTVTNALSGSQNEPPVACVATQQIFLASMADLALLDARCSSDADGDALFYSWRERADNPVVGLIPIGSEYFATLPLYFPTPGRYVFEVRVSDGVDMSSEARLITVYVPGLKGVMTYESSDGMVVVPDARVAVYGSASDAEAGTNVLDAAVSDSRGRFTLETLSPASTSLARDYYVREDRFGYRTNEVRRMKVWPDPSAKPENVYEWAMGRGTLDYVAGEVRNQAGAVLQGVRVDLLLGAGGEVKTDQTDAGGSFALSYVPYGSWTLQFNKEGYKPEIRDVNVGPGMRDLDIRMAPATGQTNNTLAGVVVLGGVEAGLAGVEVALGSGLGTKVTTDSEGAFAFSGLPVGSYVLTATKSGFETVRLPMVQVSASSPSVRMALFPVRPPVLQGTVLDKINGRPLRLARAGIAATNNVLLRSDVTDPAGYFQLLDVPLGSNQTLRVAGAGYVATNILINVLGSTRLDDIRLERAADWRAMSRPADAPVARLDETFIYLTNLSHSATLTATGSVGSSLAYLWRESPDNPVSMLPAGSETQNRIALRGFSKPGVYRYELQVKSGNKLSPNVAGVTIFAPGLAGQAHASPSDGVLGLPQVIVRAYTNYAQALGRTADYVDSKTSGSQPAGRFLFDGLATGDYWVVAYKQEGAGYQTFGPVKKRVNYSSALQETPVNLAKGEFALEGTVTDTNRVPLENVRVVVAPGAVTETYRTSTGTNGYFKLARVTGGSQMVLLFKEGYQSLVYTKDMFRDTRVDLQLTPSASNETATVRGRITMNYKGVSLPIPQAEVVIGSGLAKTYTDKDGWYSIGGLPPGYYFGLVRKAGYRASYLSDSGSTLLSAGFNTRDRVLQFEGKGPTLRGAVVDYLGQPIEGVKVAVVGLISGDVLFSKTARRVLQSIRRADGLIEYLGESDEVTGDGAGMFQLSGVPEGERALEITLANGRRVTQVLNVSGNMESAVIVPRVVQTQSIQSPFDNWKAQYFGVSTNRAGETEDADGDGLNNYEEFITGSDPTNRMSVFLLDSGVARDIPKTVWNLMIPSSSTGRLYDVYWTTNLMNPNWSRYFASSTAGNGGVLTLPVTNTAVRRYYRIGVRLP